MVDTISIKQKALAFGADERAKSNRPAETVGIIGFIQNTFSSNPVNSHSCSNGQPGSRLNCLG